MTCISTELQRTGQAVLGWLAKLVFFTQMVIVCSQAQATSPGMLSTDDVIGTWQGIYQCSAYPVRFELMVQSNGHEQLHAELKLQQYRPNGQPYPGARLPDIQLAGHYSVDKGTMLLRDVQNQQRNATMLHGVIDPKTQRLAALITPPRETNCSYAVAGKKGFNNTIDKMMEKIPHHNQRIPAQVVTSCDENIANWLRQPTTSPPANYNRHTLRYGALELFEDEKFKPYFGKSYLDMTPREDIDLHLQVARTCWQTAVESGAKDALTVIRNPSRADLVIYGHSKDIVQQWREQVLASFDTQSSQAVNDLIQSTRDILGILWPVEQSGIKTELAQKQFKNNSAAVMATLEKHIVNTGDDFNDLIKLAEFGESIVVGDASNPTNLNGSTSAGSVANRRINYRELMQQQRLQRRDMQRGEVRQPQGENTNSTRVSSQSRATHRSTANVLHVEPAVQQKAQDEIRSVINSRIKAATGPYLATITQPEAARSQLQALSAGPNQVLQTYLSPQNTAWLNQQTSQRKAELAAVYARQEAQHFADNIASGDNSLAVLRQSNSYENALTSRYGELLSASEFRAFNQQRQAFRLKLIENNNEELIDRIQTARSVDDVDALAFTYLQGNELALFLTAPIKQAMDKRKQVLAPFQGYPAADFLNAVYANDTGTVRKINQQYVDKMQRSISSFLGNDFRAQGLNTMVSHISLMTPMLASYLFAYDSHYGKCLRNDAVEFTVTTHTPGSVTTNLLGVEIARSYGYTSSQSFIVNSEFTDIFNKIGKTNTGGLAGMLVDKLLSDGSVTDIRNGMEKIMANYDCDSDVIKTLELSMRHQFSRN